jgi:uncharacterized protein (TIGR03086 family)
MASTVGLRHEFSGDADGATQLGHVVPALGAAIAGVRPTDMGLPTPCAAWTTRDLLNHVIGGAEMFSDAFGGAPVRDISGRLPDVVGDDPAAAFERAAGRFGAAIEQPGALDVVLELSFGTMTGRTFLRFVAFDLIVHTWDIASVTGASVELPDDVVREATSFAHQVFDDVPRSDLLCADPVVAPDDVTPLQRLVAFSGRRP